MARPAVRIRELEYCLPAVSPLGDKGIYESLFKTLSDDPDFEYVMVDGTIVRVHQHGTGAKGGLKIRRSGDLAGA